MSIGFVDFGGHPVSHPASSNGCVAIHERPRPHALEALIVGVDSPGADERRVELMLQGGERVHARLDAFGLDWLDVRPGDGDFEVVAADDHAVALVHGDPASHPSPLVRTHAGCLLGEALGSLLCDCRAVLDAKLEQVRAHGAGVVLYAKPSAMAPPACGARREIDPATAARLLEAAGVA